MIRPGSSVDMSVVIPSPAPGAGHSCLRCRRRMSPYSLTCVWCDMSILELDKEQWEANPNAGAPTAHVEPEIERVNKARLSVLELARHFKRIAVVGEPRQREMLAFVPTIGNNTLPRVEERPRDYVTLVHNIAHSNRWSFRWEEWPFRRSGRVTWQAAVMVDDVPCGHGTASKVNQARNQAARAALVHWGYIKPEW